MTYHTAGRAIVAGAGLAGLTAALALQDAGWRVRVYEQARSLGEIGAGITLSPGAGKALAARGLGPALLAASLPVPDIAFVHYRSGALLAGKFCQGQPADRGFETPRHLHRADLHAILLAAVTARDPDAVLTNKRITDVTQSSATVSAHFADGSTAQADILLGADGSRSAVRSTLWDNSVPEFAGQLAFRCLVPRSEAAHLMEAGHAMVFIGAGRIFNRYLIRGGDIINIIGIVRSERWQHEGWKTPATIDEFQEEFENFHPDVHALIAHAPPETLIKWGLFVRPPLAEWSAGRVILIGDAAHPILPFLGLGATLAIEDGVMLPRALATHADVPSAYAAFQACRRERVETVRTRTIEQGEIIQAADPDAFSLTRSPSQNVNLFDYDPGAVPMHV